RATTIIRIFHLTFIKGMNRINKLIGIINLEYNSGFVTKVNGIYKKPNSDKLYTATKYNLYEITNDSITIIKSLSIPEEVLNYYPLAIGNKWIYLETIANLNGFPSTYAYDFNIREVLKDTILSNGKRYFKLFDETTMNDTNYLFERIDSSNGLVYRYNFNAPPAGEEEYLIDNLLAEVNDTILSSRWRAPYSYIPDVIFYEQTLINIFGNYKNKKVFRTEFLSSYSYGLVENFGIDSVFYDWDFDYSQSVLKGCIINGVVYGDTTLTNIDDENIYAPTEFKLEQNYPNPFNPSTKISWQSPISSWQTLKVYDILGNEVATLVNEYRNAGRYEIDFSTTGGVSKLSSGVYFYQLSATGGAGNFVETKKMILLK
ncbi:MAG: T9SS type A sorting domain-containing protein, partial [Ignavibacteriota bacterium]